MQWYDAIEVMRQDNTRLDKEINKFRKSISKPMLIPFDMHIVAEYWLILCHNHVPTGHCPPVYSLKQKHAEVIKYLFTASLSLHASSKLKRSSSINLSNEHYLCATLEEAMRFNTTF